jgi:EAL domain-containing protein (putative c-di-GMP-specific phosphodiesterase class I)
MATMARAELPLSRVPGLLTRRHLLASSSLMDLGGPAASVGGVRLISSSPLPKQNRFMSAMAADSRMASSWRFLGVAELANFPALRRQLGTVRADRLTLDLAERIERLLPEARLSAVGRVTVEFAFDGAVFTEIGDALKMIEREFAQPIDIEGESCRFELALAGAGTPVAKLNDVRLAEEVEGALAMAKFEKRAVTRDLSSEMPTFDRLTVKHDLELALGRNEMILQYQPKIHVRRQEVTSVEALIRWQHPDRGLILPGDFITLAEEAGLIAEMTLWSLDQVKVDQAELRQRGFDVTIFINISGQLLGNADFVSEVCRKLDGGDWGIGFEITETSVIKDPDTAIANLQQFSRIGIPIAIDDYGAGLSSLVYLKKLPACELKIDKMFITQLTSSNRDPLIVRSTIDLAHALEMEVTAEGVESQAALALLSVMGCDMVQGFLISRPIGIAGLVRFLSESHELVDGIERSEPFNRPASFWKSV